MKNEPQNYLFLGLPESGKTTCFSLMAYHLQQLANKTSDLRFLYREDNTSIFIDDCIVRLKHKKWPDKTKECTCGYSFEFRKYGFFKMFGFNTLFINCHDCSGKAFEVAFGNSGDALENMIKNGDDIKEKIKTAAGVFLVLDSDDLFNGVETSKLENCMVNLLQFIQESNEDMRIAVLFNKLELFFNEEINLKERFRKQYRNAYSYLSVLNCHFFDVYPLGSVETKDDGKIDPPSNILPRKILDPIRWMIGF